MEFQFYFIHKTTEYKIDQVFFASYLLRPPHRVLISFPYIVRFPPCRSIPVAYSIAKVYIAQKLMLFKRVLAFRQYILFLFYKQPVSNYKGKSNNVGKPDEAPMWCP